MLRAASIGFGGGSSNAKCQGLCAKCFYLLSHIKHPEMKNKFTKWQRMTILVAIVDMCQQPRHPVFKTILTCLFTFLFFKLDLISYVCVFCLYMSLWTTGVPGVQVPEENIGSPRT